MSGVLDISRKLNVPGTTIKGGEERIGVVSSVGSGVVRLVVKRFVSV